MSRNLVKSQSYSYAGTTKTVQCGWTELMRRTIEKVMELEQREGEDGNGGEGEGRGSSGACYNFALLNYYADGKDYMGLHSDDETGLVPGSSIASISLGAERDFVFQHKQKEEGGGEGKRRKKTRTVRLGHGSLLVMKAPTQSHWKHALPQRMGVSTPRINITFRCVHQHASNAPDHPP
ncbi:Alpha-ketoglutarate-dependent dioxygenase alkB 2 [Balamuthia mandrillaris]